jgi:hypothetical protein
MSKSKVKTGRTLFRVVTTRRAFYTTNLARAERLAGRHNGAAIWERCGPRWYLIG